MEKRKAIINLILLILFVGLVVFGVVFWKKESDRKKNEAPKEAVRLRSIGYETTVLQMGFTEAGAIAKAFVDGYNNHDGAAVASIMDFVAMYIHSLCENPERDFDSKYVEYMAENSEISQMELILLQNGAKSQEELTIDSINNTNVQLELLDYTEIEDVSKYLSRFRAKIRTIDADEGIDQEDWVEFWLVHSYDTYYLIYFANTGE